MKVEDLLETYEGVTEFYDSTTQVKCCTVEPASPVVALFADFEVEEWKAIQSTKYPKIAVYCQFTEPHPEPEPEPTLEPEVENTEGE